MKHLPNLSFLNHRLRILWLALAVGWLGAGTSSAANILYLINSLVDPVTTANANDQEVRDRLVGQGHAVTLGDDQDQALGDLFAGKDLILISSSTGSGNQPLNSLVISTLRTGRIPVICYEPGLYDEFVFQRENTFGNAGGHTSIAISEANKSHPLAAAKSGTIDIVNAGETATVCSSALPYTVGTNAIIIATNATPDVDVGRINIWAYERNTKLADDVTVVPSRRIAFFYNASTAPGVYNTAATDLLDAAIKWALERPASLPITVIFRSPANQNATPDAAIIAELEDGTSTQVNTNSMVLALDGTVVAPRITKSGTITTVSFTPAGFLAAGSVHAVSLVYSDTASPPKTSTNTFQFTVQNYAILTPSLKLPAGAVDTTKPGFTLKLRQMESARPGGGNADAVRRQLDDLYIEPNSGTPFADLIDRSQTGFQPAGSGFNLDGTFTETGVLNYNQDAQGLGAEMGVFRDPAYPDKPIPGIPGTTASTDNIALQARTYLELKAGLYQFGVNSDDGFRVNAESAPQDLLRTTIIAGEFNADRGQATTTFYVLAQEDGFYPFELLFWETGVGAEVEFFSVVDPNTRANVLVNDSTDARAIKAYRSAIARPAVTAVSPAPYATGVPVTANITITIADAGTQVVTSSVQLSLDGTIVNATVTKAAGQTTVTFDPPGNLASATRHSIQLTYTDTGTPPFTRTGSASFLTDKTAITLPAFQQDDTGLAVFEAENFATNTPSADHAWVFDVRPAGYSGAGTMYSLPDSGAAPGLPGALTESPRLSYKINFVKTGTHYFWFRGSDGGGNSLHAGIDDVDPSGTTLDNMDDFSACCGTRAPGGTSHVWVGGINGTTEGRATFEVPSAGEHTIHILMREDGQIVDKLLVTTNAAFIPSGVGPAESRRAGQVPLPLVAITSPANGATFAAGANISLTATASDVDGTIAKVEYFSGTNKIGEAASPFAFTWSNVPAGRYALTAKATDNSGDSGTTLLTVIITVGTLPPDALLVISALPGNASELAVKARLESQGFTVTAVDDNDAAPALANSAALIVVSSTSGSGNITKYRDVKAPILLWEYAAYDGVGLSSGDGATIDNSQTQIQIVNASHPLAAGFPAGVVTVFPVNAVQFASVEEGLLAPSVVVVAKAADTAFPTRAVLFGLEKGALLFDGTAAPNRRAGIFLGGDTFAGLNADGLKIFDAAVKWVANLSVAPQPVPLRVVRSGNDVTISWPVTGSDGFNLQAADSLSPANWSDATSPAPITNGDQTAVTVPAAGATRFFRLRHP